MARSEVFSTDIVFDVASVKNAITQIETLRSVTLSAVKDIRDSISSIGKIDLSGISTGKISKSTEQAAKNAKNAANDSKESVKELQQQIEDVGKIADLNNKSLGRSFKNLSDGFRLARKDGGSAVLGIRTALFGLNDSTSLVAKGLDFFSKGLDQVNKSQNEFSKFGADAAEKVANLSSVMRDQGKIVSELAKTQGVSADRLNLMRSRFAEVENAAEKANRRFLQGKDATATVLELETASRRLEEQIKSLRAQDILDEDALKELAQLERILGTTRIATRQMAVAQRQMRGSVDEAKEAQKKQANVSAKGGKSIKKLGDETKIASRNTDAMERNVRSFNTSLGRTATVARAAKGALSSVFGGVFLGAFAGTVLPQILREASSLGNQMLLLASEAEETTNRFDTVFGGKDGALATSVAGSLEEIAVNFKRSVIDLKSQAAGFQDTFVPLGFARDDAASMSIALTALTQDLSSFYNVTTDEAARRLSSTLVGNTENMREFGVQINAATIDSELLALGIDATNRSASQQQKSMALLSLIYKGTKDAQGDVIRSQDEFANQNRALQATLKDLQAEAGAKLLKSITPFIGVLRGFIATTGPQVIKIFNDIIGAFAPFAEAVAAALDSGNISNLMSLFNDTLLSGINTAVDFLNDFISFAFNWGANFAIEIANGLITEGANAIVEAMNFIGDLIASFMAPGSPPETGPLSDIDTWGADLVSEFASSFEAADFRFVENALAPIKEAFVSIGGDSAFASFSSVRDLLVGLVDELNVTGEINEGTFAQIAETVGEGNEQLTRFLRLNLELQKAQKKIEDTEKEIAAAQKAGFVPKALEEKLALAKEEANEAAAAVDLQKEFLDFQKLSVDEFKKASLGAASSAASAARAGQNAVRQAVNRQLEFIRGGFDEEKRLLEEKLALGVISQEEFLKKMIRLEEKFIDASLKSGILSEVVIHVENLKNARAELDKLVLQSKAKKGGSGLIPNIDDLLGDYLSGSGAIKGDVGKKIGGIGKELATSITSSFQETFNTQIPLAVSSVFSTFTDSLKELGKKVALSIKSATLGSNILTSLLGGASLAVVAAKFGILSGSLSRFGVVVKNTLGFLGRFSGLALRLTGIVGLAILVFKNWDKIVRLFNEAVEFGAEVWQTFLEKFGGADAFLGEARDILDNISTALGTVSTNVADAIANLNSAQLVTTLKNIFASILSGDFNQALVEVKNFGSELFGELLAALDFSGIDFEAIKTFLSKAIAAIGETISDVFEDLIGQENVDKLGQVFTDIAEAVAAPFSEGTIGGTLIELFGSLVELGKVLLPILTKIAIVIGIGLAFALDVVVSLFQAFVDILDPLSEVLAGAIKIVDGIVISFSGLLEVLDGVVGLLFNLLTGQDIGEDLEKIGEGGDKIGLGFLRAFEGLEQALAGIAISILEFIVSFGANFINNITSFMGDSEKEIGKKALELSDRFTETLDLMSEESGKIMTGLVDQLGTILTQQDKIVEKLKVNVTKSITKLKDNIKKIFGQILSSALLPILKLRLRIQIAFAQILVNAVKKFNDLKTKIGDTLTNLLPTKTLAVIQEGIIEPFQKAAAAALAFIVTLGVDLVTNLQAIDVAEALTTLKDSITAPFSEALTTSSEFLGDLALKAQTFLDDIEFGDKLDTLRDKISAPFEGAKEAGATALGALKEFASGLFDEIDVGEKASGVQEAISSVFTGAEEDANPAIQKIKDSLLFISEFSLSDFVANLTTSFQGIDTVVADGLQGAIDVVTNLATTLSEIDLKSLDEIATDIGTALGTAKTTAETAAQAILTGIVLAFQDIVNQAKFLIDQLPVNVEAAINLARDFVAGLPQKIVDSLKDNTLIMAATDGISAAFTAIKETVADVQKFVTGLPQAIIDIFSGNKDKVVTEIEGVSDAFNSIKDKAQEAIDKILDLPQNIIDAFFNNREKIRSEIIAVSLFFDEIKDKVQDVVDKVLALPQAIIDAISGDKEALSTAISGIATSFASLGESVQEAIKVVISLPGKIIDGISGEEGVLGTAISDFVASFDTIPTGILDVFTEAKDNLVEFLTGGFATSLVDAVKALPATLIESTKTALGAIIDPFKDEDTDTVASDFFNPIEEEAIATRDAITSALSEEPLQEDKGLWAQFKGLFQKSADEVVNDSIVPDMVNDIVTLFETEIPTLDLVFAQLSISISTSADTARDSWVSGTEIIKTTFIKATKEMIKAVQNLKKVADDTLKLILGLFSKIVKKIKEAVEETENFISVLGELVETDLGGLVDSMERMADAMDNAKDDAEDFAKFLKEAREEAEKIGDTLGGNVPGGGGEPEFQSGAFRIPRRLRAVLHQGEMVIPAGMADSLRAFLLSLNNLGIGGRSFNIPIGQRVPSLEGQGGGGTNQTSIFNVSFPNVTDSSNAEEIADVLQELLERGRSFSMVGST